MFVRNAQAILMQTFNIRKTKHRNNRARFVTPSDARLYTSSRMTWLAITIADATKLRASRTILAKTLTVSVRTAWFCPQIISDAFLLDNRILEIILPIQGAVAKIVEITVGVAALMGKLLVDRQLVWQSLSSRFLSALP